MAPAAICGDRRSASARDERPPSRHHPAGMSSGDGSARPRVWRDARSMARRSSLASSTPGAGPDRSRRGDAVAKEVFVHPDGDDAAVGTLADRGVHQLKGVPDR